MNNNKMIRMGVVTAIAASLCCITPVLALIAGASGLASSFSWLEPARPYLIGVTILVIGFAWYQKLKSKKDIDCECEEDQKPSFWQSKKFLGLVTVFAVIMLAFPYYSGIFFPKNETKTIIIKESDFMEATLTIEGMTCTGCEHHVNHSLTSSEGVLEVTSSYETGIAKVKFDKTKVSIDKLAMEVEKETGYKVLEKKIEKDYGN
ncbi:MAG: mercuric transport protein MerTP [Cyclobacteriaceae bacterium]|nr:mercuric transport protein MerTP [Cyclobacteriaceae bacterium]